MRSSGDCAACCFLQLVDLPEQVGLPSTFDERLPSQVNKNRTCSDLEWRPTLPAYWLTTIG